MAVKQKVAVALMEAIGKVIEASICEVMGGALALVNTEAGKRLVYVTDEENQLTQIFKAEDVKEENKNEEQDTHLDSHDESISTLINMDWDIWHEFAVL